MEGEINGKEYSHSRVYKISGDQFYALLSGQEDALFQLYKSLPIAIQDYLSSIEKSQKHRQNSALDEIKFQIDLQPNPFKRLQALCHFYG